jgi:hypothetical protein
MVQGHPPNNFAERLSQTNNLCTLNRVQRRSLSRYLAKPYDITELTQTLKELIPI